MKTASVISSRVSPRILAICIIAAFGSGLGIGWWMHKGYAPQQFQSVHEGSADYTYINPLLFVKIPEDKSTPGYIQLKNDITAYADKTIADGKALDLSIYFRNMNSSQWIAIHPDETFSPASMLKVVTLISVLRAAESDPKLLSTPIILKGDDTELVGSQVLFPVENPIRVGNTYTVKELLEHLIISSDNVANSALVQLIGDAKVEKTYADLQMPKPEEAVNGYTAQQYSRLFRVLYNATYLSRPLSEQVLELLSKTTFTQGIVAGVPKATTVSHKFGVRTVLSDDSTPTSEKVSYRELHDCGIVYHPQHPYFICVMTRGEDFSVLESIIRDISKMTWNEVDQGGVI